MDALGERPRQPLLAGAGNQDQDDIGTTGESYSAMVRDRRGRARPRRTTRKLRPSWRVMMASNRPMRWSSICDLRPSMPGESDSASW